MMAVTKKRRLTEIEYVEQALLPVLNALERWWQQGASKSTATERDLYDAASTLFGPGAKHCDAVYFLQRLAAQPEFRREALALTRAAKKDPKLRALLEERRSNNTLKKKKKGGG